MKKLILVLGLVVAALSHASAQEFKLAKNSGKLAIYIGHVTVEGTTGNEIVFTSNNSPNRDEDDRAKGLRAVSGSGLEDNTGLGINVADKGNIVEVRQLKKMNSPHIKILIPKGVTVYYEYESQYGRVAKFKNIESEIEVSANYNSVELENITGPIVAKSVYGHVAADFNNNVKGPISIISVYGYVDVTLPLAIKADLKMTTSHGELYAASEFKIDYEKTSEGLVREDNRVNGKINGGGVKVDLNSDFGKVYLRKK
ncbi:MAG: hypothetical protein OJF59_000516 [Cytophagales bacterium]|jgi:predicted membrane protein|nr:DUF4097 family beta strand repeat protein [Bacteroidota bacterium]MBS1981421.1 DUF4097 family beta strand repeat protein [Bacteroidota bacterium]WHZ06763.1 MAG: hypothetical protein OJF59_000516 [Cytophagales bacterium]